jgi:hypothetical protein
MSNRNTILEGFKTTLGNISTANGFNFDIGKIERKFLYYDNIFDFPSLMVLGGPEEFEDQLSTTTASRMNVRIIGYIKELNNPESELCKLLEDVLKCLDNDTYNPNKHMMRILNVDTDEGAIHSLSDGIAMFILTLEIFYIFQRNSP